MSAKVKMYTTRFCPYCVGARNLLGSKNVEYTDIRVDNAPELRREMIQLSGRQTVPQIWIDDQHIGGYDELAILERQGSLNQLLKSA